LLAQETSGRAPGKSGRVRELWRCREALAGGGARGNSASIAGETGRAPQSGAFPAQDGGAGEARREDVGGGSAYKVGSGESGGRLAQWRWRFSRPRTLVQDDTDTPAETSSRW